MGGGGHLKCGHPRAPHCVNPGLVMSGYWIARVDFVGYYGYANKNIIWLEIRSI